MPRRFLRLFIVAGVLGLPSCEPNVLIGAKLTSDGDGFGGQIPIAAASSGGSALAGSGGSESMGGDASVGGDAGATTGGLGGDGGAGGAPPTPEWCATAPWLKDARRFESTTGTDHVLPAGNYVITYVSGAQIHDRAIGYEVTGHYIAATTIQAGHHIYSGESPEKGSTSLWLSATGLVTGKTIAEVEAANQGHTWALEHKEPGEVFVVLYDDLYEDNSGPGTRYCITPAPP